MTTAAENEILSRVGPGTPMGELMRNYWMPALKSFELKADGDPVRFRLLGENLIGFRDTRAPATRAPSKACAAAGSSRRRGSTGSTATASSSPTRRFFL